MWPRLTNPFDALHGDSFGSVLLERIHDAMEDLLRNTSQRVFKSHLLHESNSVRSVGVVRDSDGRGAVKQSQELWRRRGVLRPIRDGGAVRIQFVDEVHDIVGQIGLAISTDEVGRMDLTAQWTSVDHHSNRDWY